MIILSLVLLHLIAYIVKLLYISSISLLLKKSKTSRLSFINSSLLQVLIESLFSLIYESELFISIMFEILLVTSFENKLVLLISIVSLDLDSHIFLFNSLLKVNLF